MTRVKNSLLKRDLSRVKAFGGALLLSGALYGSVYGIQTMHAANQDLMNARAEASSMQTELNKQQETIEEQKATNTDLQEEVKRLQTELKAAKDETARQLARSINVEVTAYDLSEQSCGKAPGNPAYGLTASGTNLAGHSRESARAIAVDPRIIPLGSKVRIKFKNPDMVKYNGVYTAVDTGGAIGGNRIDLFMGDGSHRECMQFGRQQATAILL